MKNYIILSLFVAFILNTGCKNKGKGDNNSSLPLSTAKDKKAVSKAGKQDQNASADSLQEAKTNTGLVDPLKLISIKDLEEIMGPKFENKQIKCTKSGKFSRSCFIKWEDDKTGAIKSMFILLQTNPMPDEFEDWGHSFIDAKLKTGDLSYPNTNTPYIYKPVKGIREEAAYNNDLNRIYWKYNKDYVFAIFFNTGESGKKQIEYAKKIAKIINKNFDKIISD